LQAKARVQGPTVLASACKALPCGSGKDDNRWQVEGVAGTPSVVLLAAPRAPQRVSLARDELRDWRWDTTERLAWIRFTNTSSPRELVVGF